MMLFSILVLSSLSMIAALEEFARVDKTCYHATEDIVVTFENAGNRRSVRFDDFVGIYPSNRNVDLNRLDKDLFKAWVWSCGSQNCKVGLRRGMIEFGPHGADKTVFPLPAGEYQAVLATGEFQARAVSSVFTVLPPGRFCEGSNVAEIVAQARDNIKLLIKRDPAMGAKFLRLAFHDCVGGCDGCVDLTNPDNAGLDPPIQALDPVVQLYEPFGLSRPDIWMMAAYVASDVLQTQDELRIDFPFQWIGRKTCQELNNGACGSDFHEFPTSCTARRGPNRELCHADSGTETLLEFFDREFGFSAQQVVAIMGAHSVGTLNRRESGYDGKDGWDFSNFVLDHGYYIELLGLLDDPNFPLPEWKQVFVDNRDLPNMPNRQQWEADGISMVMLTADISLVRQLGPSNMNRDGSVTCPFIGWDSCPDAQETIHHVWRYSKDRVAFLHDYRDVLSLMAENGYRRTSLDCPSNQVCGLRLA